MAHQKKYLIALDQGTTSSRAVIFDNNSNIVAVSQKEFKQIYPKPGWVEHDPMEIYASQYAVMIEAIAKSGIRPYHIAAIGITNQRETTIVWDKETGKPIYNAIVWQCRRTADMCAEISKDKEMVDYIKEATGLVLDPYFSATKLKWILDNVPSAREKAKKGNLLFGTVDTWLIWKLTEGKVYATDHTNAARTMLFNIDTLQWDEKICKYFDIPMNMLPKVQDSSSFFGNVSIFDEEIPISGDVGDQQAALFGQTCFEKGDAKNTYGTGCFLLMNTGDKKCSSKYGLITTLAASYNHNIQYVLEGSVFVGGAVIQWIRDELRFISDANDSEYFATKVPDNGGVYIVPAFTGLGAPYWDAYARGGIFGLTRGSNRSHIIRAALESIAYQSNDVIESMKKDTGLQLNTLKVDGGASRNNFLMQFQSNITNTTVQRSTIMETTALGAAYLAGLNVGVWSSLDEIKKIYAKDKSFSPCIEEKERTSLVSKWHKAVKMSKNWAKDE